jgi:hypothetical protein
MWTYEGKPIQSIVDLPKHDELVGFCYKITNMKTGSIYIGKKNFYTERKKKLTKKEIAALPDKRFKHHKHVKAESNWKNYYGSSKQLQADMRRLGAGTFTREIIHLATTKKYLTYLELQYQFQYKVLSINSYNANILGRFYACDIEKVDAA